MLKKFHIDLNVQKAKPGKPYSQQIGRKPGKGAGKIVDPKAPPAMEEENLDEQMKGAMERDTDPESDLVSKIKNSGVNYREKIKDSDEIGAQDIFASYIQEGKSPEEAAETTLDLMSGGMTAALEGGGMKRAVANFLKNASAWDWSEDILPSDKQEQGGESIKDVTGSDQYKNALKEAEEPDEEDAYTKHQDWLDDQAKQRSRGE